MPLPVLIVRWQMRYHFIWIHPSSFPNSVVKARSIGNWSTRRLASFPDSHDSVQYLLLTCDCIHQSKHTFRFLPEKVTKLRVNTCPASSSCSCSSPLNHILLRNNLQNEGLEASVYLSPRRAVCLKPWLSACVREHSTILPLYME